MSAQREQSSSEPRPVADGMIGFLQEVQHTVGLRSPAEAGDLSAAVFCALLSAVSRDQAHAFVSRSPAPLRELLYTCELARGDAPPVEERAQVIGNVATRLGLDLERTATIMRLVIAAALTWLPPEGLETLRLEVPAGLRDLWIPEVFAHPS